MSFFYKRIAPKIVDVICPLPPVVVPYIKESHEEILRAISRKGRTLQTKDLGKDRRLWVLWEDWFAVLKVELSPGKFSFVVIKAFAGWTLDFASIPGLLESLEKRDDRSGIIAASNHDVFFAIGFPFFDIANDYFYQLNRFYGMGRFRSWRRWRGVQSCFGWDAWEESEDPKDREDESRFVSCIEVPSIKGMRFPGVDAESEIEMRRRF